MIYRNSGGVSGQPPLNFKNYSGSIQDYLIEGNTSQNGTPSPEALVDVQGCGERTRNLFDAKWFVDTAISANGTVSLYGNTVILSPTVQDAYVNCVYSRNQSVPPEERKCCIPVSPATEYTIIMEDARKSYISFIGSDYSCVYGYLQIQRTTPQEPFTFTTPSNCTYIVIRLGQWVSSTATQIEFPDIMLVEGSEAPSVYIPYGYKLPPTINGTEYPIYLGAVPTTRRIKKLVLTGEEDNWTVSPSWKQATTSVFYHRTSDIIRVESTNTVFILSDRFKATTRDRLYSGNSDMIARTGIDAVTIRISDSIATTVTNLKAWLAQQYAAGTPVTIWYVLATPEIAVVNEPLHKIGNYADTISKSQSNLPIPTISGQNTLTIPTTISPSNVSLTLDQKEIEKIYEGGKKEVELSGVPPISFNAIGSQLEDYLIEGNTSQNGTPSPTNPVEVLGCGMRTGNLFDDHNVINIRDIGDRYGTILLGGTYSIYNQTDNTMYYGENNWLGLHVACPPYSTATITLRSDPGKVSGVFMPLNSASQGGCTVIEGSTPPSSYIPYGYKLPLTVNGQEIPIYLGQVPTTRRIRKVVFDGTEQGWGETTAAQGAYRFYLQLNDSMQSDASIGAKSYCTHFTLATTGNTYNQNNSYTISADNNFFIRKDSDTRLAAFKQWLATQYAAGTPVTVWYVLTEPETGIVNEPLHKIGDYVDSISKSQSNFPIPITTGSNTLSIETTIQPSNITIDYNKQTEIAEVYGGIGENYPIYYMNRTIEGTSPIMFKGLGKDLNDYTILGDTSQNGTPSPDYPVDVVGCGVWDETQQSYKLPITVNGTEYPIYLGQVPTTRKIRKLVLTGEEAWLVNKQKQAFLRLQATAVSRTVLSTHYKGVIQAVTGNVWINATLDMLIIMDTANATDTTVFKSYLAAQYANGTPVTVWYVLAEPETGIVNEPLHKIGNYADTISMAQAGVTIPTVSGANVLDMTSAVKPSAVSITGNIKPT